jgi:hypothetical protein
MEGGLFDFHRRYARCADRGEMCEIDGSRCTAARLLLLRIWKSAVALKQTPDRIEQIKALAAPSPFVGVVLYPPVLSLLGGYAETAVRADNRLSWHFLSRHEVGV